MSKTVAQTKALTAICERFDVAYNPDDFGPVFDLPKGWVAGWVGSLYIGCDPDGRISS